MKIDINADIGESFGHFKLGHDEELIKLISSANIACGFHAGDPIIMRKTVRMAKENNVQVGSHAGLPDLMGFGRRFIDITTEEYMNYLIYQAGALQAIAKAEGVRLQHFTGHAIAGTYPYDREEFAKAMAEAAAVIDEKLIIPVIAGPKGELMKKAAEALGLRVIRKFFADRVYNSTGDLVSRKIKGSVITNPEEVANRVIRMICEGKVSTVDGTDIEIHAKTVVVHGDSKNAVESATLLRKRLEENQIKIVPMGELV